MCQLFLQQSFPICSLQNCKGVHLENQPKCHFQNFQMLTTLFLPRLSGRKYYCKNFPNLLKISLSLSFSTSQLQLECASFSASREEILFNKKIGASTLGGYNWSFCELRALLTIEFRSFCLMNRTVLFLIELSTIQVIKEGKELPVSKIVFFGGGGRGSITKWRN